MPAGTCALRGTADRRLPFEALLLDVGDRRPRVLVGIGGGVRVATVEGVSRLARAVPTGLLSADRSTSGDLGQVTVGRDRQFLVPAHRFRSEPTASGPIPPLPVPARRCVSAGTGPDRPIRWVDVRDGGLAPRNPIRQPHRMGRQPTTYASSSADRQATACTSSRPVTSPTHQADEPPRLRGWPLDVWVGEPEIAAATHTQRGRPRQWRGGAEAAAPTLLDAEPVGALRSLRPIVEAADFDGPVGRLTGLRLLPEPRCGTPYVSSSPTVRAPGRRRSPRPGSTSGPGVLATRRRARSARSGSG